MIDYPYKKSIAELVKFEKSNSEWCADIPELSADEIEDQINKCLIPETRIALYLLSHVLDQNNVSSVQADRAFSCLQSYYYELLSCFRAISLLGTLSTSALVWMSENLQDVDIYDHLVWNLLKRTVNDDPEAKLWFSKSRLTIDEDLLKSFNLD